MWGIEARLMETLLLGRVVSLKGMKVKRETERTLQ